MRKIFFCFCLLVIIVSGKEKIEYKEGEIIVKFRNFTKDRITTFISQKDLSILKEFKNLKNLYVLKTSKKNS